MSHLTVRNGDVANSPSPALLIPEILGNIFDQLLRPRDVANCALVRRQWRTPATEALWREYHPDLCVLQSMHEQGTLSAHLPLIRRMDIRCIELHPVKARKDHMAFLRSSDWAVSRADSLRICLSLSLMRTKFTVRLIQPRLRSIELSSGCYGNGLLEALHSKAPKLESLDINDNRSPERMTPSKVLAFLKNMPQLRKINGILFNIPNSVLRHLARRENLECVSISRFGSEDWFASLCESTVDLQCFTALQSLDICDGSFYGEDPARILPLLRNLRKLSLSTLVTVDNNDSLFPLLACPLLTDVTISIGRSTAVELPDTITIPGLLRFFTVCRHLQRVLIYFICPYKPKSIHGRDFQQLANALPKIRVLSLPLSCNFGIDELRALQKCRDLIFLGTEGSTLNYDELQDLDAPVLPSVKIFFCDRFKKFKLPAASGMVVLPHAQWKVMRHCFPAFQLPYEF